MTSSPYAEAFHDYWTAGWRGVLPLPYARKKSPPDDYTGYDGAYPSYGDCHTWSQDGPRNIALRMPANVVGIDVDDYGGKGGGATLARLVADHGPLPKTRMSTSRGDGISGIRFYRIPEGTVLPSKLPGIEFIQRHHRYAVAYPSIHPDTGDTYQWIDEETGTTGDGIPDVEQLPELPDRWIAGLHVTERTNHTKTNLTNDRLAAIVSAMPEGDPCHHITAGAGKALEGGDRHDSYNEAVLAVAGAGRRGCPGAHTVIARLRCAFIAEVTAPVEGAQSTRRSKDEATHEWRRNLRGALELVADDPQGVICPDDVAAYLAGETRPPQPDTPTDPGTPEEPSDPAANQHHLNVIRKAAELRTLADARELLANEDAGKAPQLTGIDLREFLDQPDDPVRYRVNDLWPAHGRVLFTAAAKAGKTTTVAGNLIPALVDGGTFLETFNTTAVNGTVALFNMEVSESTMRAWMRRSGVANTDRVIVINLRGRSAALGLATPAGRARVAKFLTDNQVEVAILDPLAPVLASLGLDENANPDVAKFFSWWSETLTDAGVTDDLIVHHTGHDGTRSRGASRLLDEPDAIWNLNRDKTPETSDNETVDIFGPVTPRYFSAYGRDVDQPESGLSFNGVTRKLTLIRGSRTEVRQRAKHEATAARIVGFITANPGSTTREITASGGRTRDNTDALHRLVESGIVEVRKAETGPNPAHHHFITSPNVSHVSHVCQPSGNMGEQRIPKTPPLRSKGGLGNAGSGNAETEDTPETWKDPVAALITCTSCNRPAKTSPCSTCRSGAPLKQPGSAW